MEGSRCAFTQKNCLRLWTRFAGVVHSSHMSSLHTQRLCHEHICSQGCALQTRVEGGVHSNHTDVSAAQFRPSNEVSVQVVCENILRAFGHYLGAHCWFVRPSRVRLVPAFVRTAFCANISCAVAHYSAALCMV